MMEEFVRKWGTKGASLVLKMTTARLRYLTKEEMERIRIWKLRSSKCV